MRILTMGLWILTVLLVAYGLILLLMYVIQSRLIYYPASQLPYTPADISLEYEDIFFTTEDSVQLNGWLVPHDNARGTILFQHGNAGNISGRLATILLIHKLRLNVLIYDYRGYGKSEGNPTEEGTYRDARAAWNYLTKERAIQPGQIILMGRSLGGAVAAWLATKVQPGGVILESTFTSAADLGAELYPLFPVRWIIHFNYTTINSVKKIDVPLLIVHSKEDDLVPFSHGKKLFEAANEPKIFLEIQGNHGNGFLETGERYVQALDRFIDTVQGKGHDDR